MTHNKTNHSNHHHYTHAGMIGEVYVIRHDVNLHSEILGTYALQCFSSRFFYSGTIKTCSLLHSLIFYDNQTTVLNCIKLPFLKSFYITTDTPDFFWKEDASVEDEYK